MLLQNPPSVAVPASLWSLIGRCALQTGNQGWRDGCSPTTDVVTSYVNQLQLLHAASERGVISHPRLPNLVQPLKLM